MSCLPPILGTEGCQVINGVLAMAELTVGSFGPWEPPHTMVFSWSLNV